MQVQKAYVAVDTENPVPVIAWQVVRVAVSVGHVTELRKEDIVTVAVTAKRKAAAVRHTVVIAAAVAAVIMIVIAVGKNTAIPVMNMKIMIVIVLVKNVIAIGMRAMWIGNVLMSVCMSVDTGCFVMNVKVIAQLGSVDVIHVSHAIHAAEE